MPEYRMSEYQGGYNSLDPDKAYSNTFTGYRAANTSLAMTTDPRSANILKEASTKLSSGVGNIELTMVSPEIFDSIPKQHLKEVNELAKLTGIDISVHGPVMDTAGFTQQGYSDVSRESAERKISDFLLRIQEVKPDGKFPVVFHSAEGIAGSEWETLGDSKKGEERKARKLIAVNRENGQMTALEKETKYYPAMRELSPEVKKQIDSGKMTQEKLNKIGEKAFKEIPIEKGKVYTPEQNLEIANTSDWDNKISGVLFNKERADEILQKNAAVIQQLFDENGRLVISPSSLTPTQSQAYNHYVNAKAYLEDTDMQIRSLFSKAYKYGTENQRKQLKDLGETYGQILKEKGNNPLGQSKALQFLINNMKDSDLAPKTFVPIEEFATEKAAETFGNATFRAWKKYKDKTPIVAIENPPAGFGLSTGEDLRNVVEASRKKFTENLVKEGMNEKQAKKTAEKFIGATWDVGHINMLRKQGFSEEDIVKESEKIAPYIKHVHLSDNFGFEHTELPMGMGNVPMKEIMEKLGKKGFEAKKVIEAANWWQHFQTNPLKESFEGLGVPFYESASPATVGGMPYWNQSLGFYQSYGEGFGRMLPGINYQTFGAGFSQLPSHLGGDAGGGQGSRMSGNPME